MKKDAKEFQSIGELAAQVLADCVERAKRASGGLKRPEQIRDSGYVPVPEKVGEESVRGEVTRHPRPHHTAREGQAAGLVFHNDNCAGRVMASEAGMNVEMRRPASSADSYLDLFTESGKFQKPNTARW